MLRGALLLLSLNREAQTLRDIEGGEEKRGGQGDDPEFPTDSRPSGSFFLFIIVLFISRIVID